MYKIDYLLKYVSNDCYNNIINNASSFTLDSLYHYRINVDLNIRYLIKLGIKNIDGVVYDRLEDLIKSNNDFIDMVNRYIKTIGKDGFIKMIENV